MAKKQDYTDDEFKKLLREISKRFAICGLVVIVIGFAIVALMYFLYGGAPQ